MLLHRRRPPNAGTWNGIGGRLKPGEDPFTACIREVREETGFSIADPTLVGLLVITVRSTGDLWVLYVFRVIAPEGKPIASEEGDLRWVDGDQILSLHTPADLPVILPRILKGDEVLVARLEYETEDATEIARLEIL